MCLDYRCKYSSTMCSKNGDAFTLLVDTGRNKKSGVAQSNKGFMVCKESAALIAAGSDEVRLDFFLAPLLFFSLISSLLPPLFLSPSPPPSIPAPQSLPPTPFLPFFFLFPFLR